MYQSHVYLEVRILVSAEKKAFCPCYAGAERAHSAAHSTAQNMELCGRKSSCPVCRQEDGAVPLPNPQAVEKASLLAHALGCTILKESRFERPLAALGTFARPEGVSLSGLSLKVAENGAIPIEFHRRKKTVHIEEIRLEEDAGRLTHSDGSTRMDYTWAGCASIRLRTAADFELGEEAELFLDELRQRIQYLQIVNGPADSVMRCNAYAALARYPEMPGYYVKLRNLNSFNFVRKAVNSELSRQEEILLSGNVIPSESRLWNERQNRTEHYQMRTAAETSCFVPLDIPCIRDGALPEKASISAEFPDDRKKRLMAAYGLAKSRADMICDEKRKADFFEEAIAFGADPMDAAHWIPGEVATLLRRSGKEIGDSPLTAKRFADIMQLFSSRQIHSGIARQLLQNVLETDTDPEEIIRLNRWEQITDEESLLPHIKKVIAENPAEAEKLRDGDMAPLEFLTGLVMKKTGGLAAPGKVKELIKRELHISLVYLLAMGGAICGGRRKDGAVTAAVDEQIVRSLLSQEGLPSEVRVQIVQVGKLLSEEIEPADWAVLIAEISARIAAGTATGIVVAYGTDTLAYTAGLLYWLFAGAGVPVIVTASSAPPDASDEAARNINLAVRTASAEKEGVYVVFGEKILSPVNLKFERPSPEGFRNWNMKTPVFTGSGLLSGFHDTDSAVMTEILREAADRMFICRVYPGMRAELPLFLMDRGVTHFFLELYETGTGSMREGPYSLKPLLTRGGKQGCRFYCTSQQESAVDFSGYTTSRRVWREGAVPMGHLTTESAVSLYFAASLVSDSLEELDRIIESFTEVFS
ncbi:MAG: asparaginase domain-containing protein [Spirochaetaceae bacterium]|jgi:aspartyl-tRNA(Asn)/glutamyl-tRNA(Gln) amidotransferase subunit B|nr:asparaginase domain-containing protein [Spirochaetaceae bacterium]